MPEQTKGEPTNKKDVGSSEQLKEDSKNQNSKQDSKDVEELSEEDQKLKSDLDLMVERVGDPDAGVEKLALESLRTTIRESTSSMTSVPRPLKFLRPHYTTLKAHFAKITNDEVKRLLADILSVLAMTLKAERSVECLSFKIKGNIDDIGSWGHEYIRHLSAEIGKEYQRRKEAGDDTSDLMLLVKEIIPLNIKHNAEHEACDLLLEVESVPSIVEFADLTNFQRICTYLTQCSNYLPEPEDKDILRVVLKIYQKLNQYTDALRVSIRLRDFSVIKEVYESCPSDSLEKKQLCYILGRQHLYSLVDDENDEELQNIMSNAHLGEQFIALGKDLDILEPKTPEDIYKSHLTETRMGSSNVDSARQNLASTFVNGFVNAAFGTDKLMTVEDGKWLYRNKDDGMMSAAASLGMLLLWNEEGFLQIDKFLYASEDFIKAGGVLACGIVNSGVRNEMDPVFALLSDYIDASNSKIVRMGAILGLGLAYVGTHREDLTELLSPILEDADAELDLVCMAALALGMIFVGAGSSSPEVAESLTMILLEREPFDSTFCRFFCLGLGLVYFGVQEDAEVPLETLKAMSTPYKDYAVTVLETCAYACTGNVLKVQEMLHKIAEPLDKENKSQHQAVAVLGIALISMAEELGSEMCLRVFDHILQYGEPVIRQAVPLALGLASISNPQLQVIDTLSKLSHDAIAEVSMGAILALGLCGAGTNNSRIAGLLRQLSSYYSTEANHLFIVKIAQGLLHMGKGTMTLSPLHSHGGIVSPVALAGLLTVMHAALDMPNLILGKSHYLLFSLVTAMYPRCLITLDENLQPIQVPVRVGQALDTVGQAGRPKTITGFQTHSTPVLIAAGERAELATEEYESLSSVLENFVILKKKPENKK